MALAKRCLTADRDARPRDAGEVAAVVRGGMDVAPDLEAVHLDDDRIMPVAFAVAR